MISLLVFLFVSCKKRTEIILVNTTDDIATQTIIASDEFEVNYELDQTTNEAILASSISTVTSGVTDTSNSSDILFTAIPDAVIDTNKIDKGIITITYYGKNLDKTRARTGSIEIRHTLSSGKVVPWTTKEASMTLKYNQYEVVFLKVNNKSIVLDGTCTITNISGGLLKTLLPGDSLVDKVNAKLAFTNNDNNTVLQQWIWNFSRHQVFKLNGTTIKAKLTGDTTINNITNVSTWGITRSNQPFCTSIITPVFQNISGSSSLYVPLSGIKNIREIKEPIEVTYGVDQNGNFVGGQNPYGYKFKWVDESGITKGALVNY